tara:strand:+ start:46 stop:669 length:624 start_codon:yes stop_codon:yes gene_type:complete
MTVDKSYWNNFYKSSLTKNPSNFAKFLSKRNKIKKPLLIDFGCGNARDTFYFLSKNFSCFGIDTSKEIISKNNSLVKDIFFKTDCCKKNFYFKSNKKFDYIYARFFIHAINLKGENFFLSNIKKLCDKKTKIFLEFRTPLDPLYKKGKVLSEYERYTDHYRRFVDPDLFLDRCKKYGFKKEYMKTSFNFAKFRNQKPHICRLILSKI